MIYLCSPYTSYRNGDIWAAYQEAARIAGLLTKQGHTVYSPVVHSHPLAIYAKIDPLNWQFWMKADAPFVAACQECLVAMMEGWRESQGVTAEIAEFQRVGKPVHYVDPVTLKISEKPREDVA